MSTAMRELRSAVMILVEAVNTPIGVGSKLMIQWRFDQLAPIAPNLDGVAREKAAFDGWQSMKKQATESMSEAVEPRIS